MCPILSHHSASLRPFKEGIVPHVAVDSVCLREEVRFSYFVILNWELVVLLGNDTILILKFIVKSWHTKFLQYVLLGKSEKQYNEKNESYTFKNKRKMV